MAAPTTACCPENRPARTRWSALEIGPHLFGLFFHFFLDLTYLEKNYELGKLGKYMYIYRSTLTTLPPYNYFSGPSFLFLTVTWLSGYYELTIFQLPQISCYNDIYPVQRAALRPGLQSRAGALSKGQFFFFSFQFYPVSRLADQHGRSSVREREKTKKIVPG